MENFIEWYRVTCDVWPSIKDSIGEEKKPPAHFDLEWDDTILSAKLAFDTYDSGCLFACVLPRRYLQRDSHYSNQEYSFLSKLKYIRTDDTMRDNPVSNFCTDDVGLITPEEMLEVALPVWDSKPSGEPITTVEQVKLSEELLNYRQRANNGMMSFQDFAAWHSRISQVRALNCKTTRHCRGHTLQNLQNATIRGRNSTIILIDLRYARMRLCCAVAGRYPFPQKQTTNRSG